MKIKAYAVLVSCFFFAFSLPLEGQSVQQQESLRRLHEEFNRRFEQQKTEALRFADSLGLVVRQELPDGSVVELMRVKDGIPMYYITHNANGASVINSDKVYPGGSAGLSLTGAGQTLGIWDAGAVHHTHQEFMINGASRVTQRDTPAGNHWHATHVAGTMIAAGVETDARGMSYEAALDAYDWNNDEAEMALAAANDGLQVSQHSYGYITGWAWNNWSGYTAWHWWGNTSISETEDYLWGFYSTQARDWDEIAHNAPHYLIVKSAGNDRGRGPDNPESGHYVRQNSTWVYSTAFREKDGGADGYQSISHSGVAKNIITVGAVQSNGTMSSFSGWGPSDDGRIKPDVVAKGVNVYSPNDGSDGYRYAGGTSMSGPMVSGSVGLLLEHQQNLHPDTLLTAASLKALILHSADDMVSGAAGPDYRFGWGMMDTEAAAAIMTENAASRLHIHELSLNDGEEIRFRVKATGDEALRATIVWTDVPGTPPPASLNPTDLMLVNDLDMRLTSLHSNTTHLPYILGPEDPAAAATTGDNFRDNVEVIHIAEPGQYESFELTISHKGTLTGGSQDFSLVISGNVEAKTRWTGTLSQDWDNPGNWSAGTPVSGERVVIAASANNPVLPADKEVGELLLESDAGLSVDSDVHLATGTLHIAQDASLTLAPGAWLSVEGSLVNNGLLHLKSNAEKTAGLMHHGEGVTARIDRHFAGAEKWRLVSSPVENQVIENGWTPSGSYPDGSGYDFYSYDESAATWRNQKAPGNGITHFIPGRGYLVSYQEADQDKVFEGPVSTESVSVSVSHTEGVAYAGANLIGNPYATGIDWHLVERSLFADDYAYLYDPFLHEGSGGYVPVNGAQEGAFIAPHQGFFVLKEDPGTANFTFHPEMRIRGGTFTKEGMYLSDGHRPDTHPKDTGKPGDELVLKLSGARYFDKTYLQLRDEASFGRDRSDALKFFSFNREAPQLYSLSDDGLKLAVNNIPYLPEGKAIALGVHLPATGSYVLSVCRGSTAFTGRGLFLSDTREGRLHKFSAGTPYVFTGSPDDPAGRFLLFFGDVAVGMDDEPDPATQVSIQVYNNTLFLDHAEENALVGIYDTMGRLLLQFRATAGNQRIPLRLPAGAYIVSVTGQHTTTTAKVLLR